MKKLLLACLAVAASFSAIADSTVSVPAPGPYTLFRSTVSGKTTNLATIKTDPLPTLAACSAAAATYSEKLKVSPMAFVCRTDAMMTTTYMVPVPCPAAPAASTRPGFCPAGAISSWTQTSAPVSAPKPACWASGPFLPASAPAGGCTTPAPPAVTDGYAKCGGEGDVCKVSATAPGFALYGADTRFSKPTPAYADFPCGTSFFGLDPAYGTVKACWFRVDPTVPPPAPVSTADPSIGYTTCSADGQLCTLPFPAYVIRGAGHLPATWSAKPSLHSGAFYCNGGAAIDPAQFSPGAVCAYKDARGDEPLPSYVKCADENGLCTINKKGLLTIGMGTEFSTPVFAQYDIFCSADTIGVPNPTSDPRTTKACWFKADASGSTDPTSSDMSHQGPYVDDKTAFVGDPGTSEYRVSPTDEVAPATDGGGAFRTSCTASLFARFDPIVFFGGLPGISHPHTFFGNTGINPLSTTASLRASGNSTCRGGIANRSAYWVPSMIDTGNDGKLGQILLPDEGIGVYYKSGGVLVVDRGMPEGLRMISGIPIRNSPRTDADPFNYRFKCIGGPNNENDKYGSAIPDCDVGATMISEVFFPQCWDGKNLDSPDHKAHMSFGETYLVERAAADGGNYYAWRCPATHPVALPSVTFNVEYTVPQLIGPDGKPVFKADGSPQGSAIHWRLASDAYGQLPDGSFDPKMPGGYSSHGDWFNAWDPAISDTWAKFCDQQGRDCHSHLLGDGRMLY